MGMVGDASGCGPVAVSGEKAAPKGKWTWVNCSRGFAAVRRRGGLPLVSRGIGAPRPVLRCARRYPIASTTGGLAADILPHRECRDVVMRFVATVALSWAGSGKRVRSR